MNITSVSDIQNALKPKSPDSEEAKIKIADLYEIWKQRVPIPKETDLAGSIGQETHLQLPWVQASPQLVANFAKQALLKEEYLLVCQVYDEVGAYWTQETKRNPNQYINGLVSLRRQYAEAQTRLGFTRNARRVLEPLANNRRLFPEKQTEIYLQIGDIIREESHFAPDPATSLQRAADALAFYEKALAKIDKDPDSDSYKHLQRALILNAAMHRILAQNEQAHLEKAETFAREALSLIEKEQRRVGALKFNSTWFRAVALSVLGRLDEAYATYQQLKECPDQTTKDLAEARFRSQFLATALDREYDYFYQAFPPLELLVFSGHVPDRPDKPPRFPVKEIDKVSAWIEEKVNKLEARVGLVSAAAGADLLFIEALQKRGAKYHIVLPWSKEEFLKTSVIKHEPKERWEKSFAHALDKADSIRQIGQIYKPTHDVTWEFTQEFTAGYALLLARRLRLDLRPVALWNEKAGYGSGGTQSFVQLWREDLKLKTELVARDELKKLTPPSDTPASSEDQWDHLARRERSEISSMHQVVKSILFADVVGYSKFRESVMGEFVQSFMHKVSALVAKSEHAPQSINTWGDGLFAVFDHSLDAGKFAVELNRMVLDEHDLWVEKGLCHVTNNAAGEEEKHPLNIRIGLHTGPVLAHFNPVLRQLSFTGTHVSRAARIEPKAQQGEVYASEEFAAMAELGVEINRLKEGNLPVAEFRRDLPAKAPVHDGFISEFAGTMSLAKNYPGNYHIYRLIPHRPFAMEELAQAAHELYREKELLSGKSEANNPALLPWEKLVGKYETYKQANRAQVADVPNKLHYLGYEIAPNSGLRASEIRKEMTPETIAALAQREHDRWCKERERNGWTYAPVRNNEKKHHPLMIPWEKLYEADKQKDCDIIENIPVLIEKAGLRLRKINQEIDEEDF